MSMKRSALVYLLAYIVVFTLDGVQRLIPDKEMAFLAPLLLYPIFCFWGLYLFRNELLFQWRQFCEEKFRNSLLVIGVYIGDIVALTCFSLISIGFMDWLQITSPLDNDENISRVMQLVSPFFSILALGILGPIVEELVFRHILQDYLKKNLSTWLTVTLQALLFALIHVHKWQMSEVIHVLPHFASGLVLGLAKEKTGNTWFAIFPHIGNNVLGLLHYL